ncbi:MAG: hypothetical protein H6733_06740 [Alphaproteobacteria bacterium]|nr:hypothetical protein [Alphaproteobacteria bacterium]
MASLARRYIREAQKQTAFYPAWLPLQTFALGDYGLLAGDGTFTKKGNLAADFGIDIRPTPDMAMGTLKLSSTSGVSFELKLAGTVSTGIPQVPQGSAGFKVGFNRRDALFFELYDATQRTIDNLAAVEAEVTRLYIKGEWTKRWVIVHTVVAGRGTIAFSGDSDGEYVVGGQASFTDIADVTAGLQVLTKRSVAFEVVASPITPLFLAARLQPVGSVSAALGLDTEGFTPASAKAHKAYMALVDVAPKADDGDED